MTLASERAVVIFSNSTCCMCHTVKDLFIGQLGVNPAIYKLNKNPRGREMECALAQHAPEQLPHARRVNRRKVGRADRPGHVPASRRQTHSAPPRCGCYLALIPCENRIPLRDLRRVFVRKLFYFLNKNETN
ncbi:Glutaredoxin-C1 [Platanthera zijinensis]|uniref:Glutaredoxin-C1 n=1 Tax=Platanthera zijinensis TaxID=2320716 RepID=A0AAP0BQI7_9ASPA